MNKDKICQNCKFMGKNDGAGWCKEKENFTARKATCKQFRRK